MAARGSLLAYDTYYLDEGKAKTNILQIATRNNRLTNTNFPPLNTVELDYRKCFYFEVRHNVS